MIFLQHLGNAENMLLYIFLFTKLYMFVEKGYSVSKCDCETVSSSPESDKIFEFFILEFLNL